jgi:hypothetical protein
MPEAYPSAGSEEQAPPAGAPAGPVTVQVGPQGHVTVTVHPPVTMPSMAGLEAATPEAFNLFGGAQAEEAAASPFKSVLDSLKSALETLSNKIVDFANDVTTLEVRTFVSDRIEDVRPDGAVGFTHAQQRAMTHIDFDGDTQVVVPVDAGQIDQALWRIHLETVEQAQAHRQAMLKTIGELMAGFIPAIK